MFPVTGLTARDRAETVVADLDRMLGEQVNLILHHPAFQAIEASWRGLPYGGRTDPQDDFAFEEDTDGVDVSTYLWVNAAFAFANVVRAFSLYGWCTPIRGIDGGGIVDGLIAYRFASADGDTNRKCVTKVALSEWREAELSRSGFIPLLHRKNTDYAAFVTAQSLQQPQAYDDPAATANAILSSRLPYLFATCRFAHYR